MNFNIERPWALYGILFLIPVLIYCVFIYRKTSAVLYESYKKNNSFNFQNVKKRIFFRVFFRCLAWCMVVFAYAGISWGTVSSPVQKNGSAISLVFDISYSMTALDAPEGLSRLEASASYARTLLSYVEDSSISAVLAKGSGVVAVPLTEDTKVVYSLLDSISPSMLSSAGSDLGAGVLAALKSFPNSISMMPVIWLFTDGDETVNSLSEALNTALRQGISVVIIGFGSERESEILAGDGKTSVKTALRSEKLEQLVDSVNKKNFGEQGFKFFKGASAKYVDATQLGSAIEVLSSIKNNSFSTATSDEALLAYEIHPIERHRLFIVLAILLFVMSFIASEFSPRNLKETLALSLIAVSFSSCSSEFHESKKILEATWNWHQKDYTEAIADFSNCISLAEANEDNLIKQYALYGLSSTYLMQNENAASLEKVKKLSQDAPDKIRFAAFYNSGIIAQRGGEYEKAAELFKQALLIDSTNINAKINLEVLQNQRVQNTQEGEQTLSGADETKETNSLLEQSVFNRIRENEQKQWKNLQTPSEQPSVLDY